jgi:tetratricopeptide (TPR) repeat protein
MLPALDLPGRRLGDYRVGAELGRGGMGAVYRAEALEDGPAGPAGTAVAIKVFHPHLVRDERAFERFRREAEIGKSIRHAHVVRTHDVGSAEVEGRAVHYMVMELIEGQTLEALLAELGTVPDRLLLEIADQVLLALEAIHGRGIIHRDIKPGNIVITPDHRVLLMDMGVARLQAEGEGLTQAGEFVGSMAYAAPEQFLATERIGARVDIYAFGVVLFELATGKNPYDTRDVAGLLARKLKGEIAEPRSVRPDLDAFWNEVIATATRGKPSERFASAAELRQVLREGEAGEWWRRRAAGVAAPTAERALRRLRLEREAPLTGRREAMARLRDAWAGARAGGGVLVLSGPSGAGKSRLLYDFLEEVAAAGGPAVVAGRAVGSGGRSYQPFVEALGDLLDPGEGDPAERRARLEGRLRALLADTPGVVPHMVEFLLGGMQPGIESGFTADALLAACARIVQRTAAERPLIVAIEDLHLAGAESLDLFRHLARAAPGPPVLLLGVVEEPLEGALPRLEVAPLPFAATEDLVRAVVVHERTVRALAHPLHRRGEGNPAIVLEMLAQLRRSGALVAEGQGLALQGAFDEATVPRTARDLVGLRLGRLDDDGRETLEVASILGYEFDANLLADVLGEPRITLLKRLAALERNHRLVVGAGKSAFRFASRQVYEAVYDSITEALRTEYHAVVADTMSREGGGGGPERAYALLYHLVEAGRAGEAEPYVEPALDYIGASFHATYATPFLEKTLEALAASPAAKRNAIAMKLWAFYELLARREDQLRVLAVARETADQPGSRARAHACTAHTFSYTGDFAAAEAEAELGLALAREARDRRWESNVLHLLGLVDYRRGRFASAAKRWRAALAIRREIGDRRGEASSLQALGAVMPLVGERDRSVETKLAALEIYREIGDRRGEGALLNNVANSLVDVLRVEESLERFEEAIRISRELGDATTEAQQLGNMGHAYAILGRVERAKECFDRALDLFRALDSPNGELTILTLLAPVLATFGDYGPARERLEAAAALAQRIGAKPKLAAAERGLASLLHETGARAEARERFDRAMRLEEELGSPSGRADTLSAMAEAALREGDHARAARLLDEARRLPVSGIGGEKDVVLACCRLARARRALGQEAEAAEAAAEAERRLAALPALTPDVGPEIHFTLRDFARDEEGRSRHLQRAHALVEQRQGAIRNDAYRDHYERTWPNAAILAETKRGGPPGTAPRS